MRRAAVDKPNAGLGGHDMETSVSPIISVTILTTARSSVSTIGEHAERSGLAAQHPALDETVSGRQSSGGRDMHRGLCLARVPKPQSMRRSSEPDSPDGGWGTACRRLQILTRCEHLPMQRDRTLTVDVDFRARPNSLGALRLALAVLVVVSHSWQLGGYGEQLKIGGTYLSTWGLFGFFSISGFLIMRSRLSRPSLLDFLWARSLRIYPGFLVCLFAVAFIFAPASQMLDPEAHYRVASAVRYVLTNLPLYPPVVHQQYVGDTLGAVPFANNWDEPMWSLFYEAGCYVLVGVLVTIVRRRSIKVVIPGLFAAATVVNLLAVQGVLVLRYQIAIGLILVTLFLGGSVLCVFADHLPAARWDVVVSLGILGVVVLTRWETVFAALPLAHLLIRASTLLPLHRIGRRWDLSYGVYIYGVPVQQLVVLAFPLQTLPLWGFIMIVLAGVLPIAFLSSALVETPMLRFKSKRPRIAMLTRVPQRALDGKEAIS